MIPLRSTSTPLRSRVGRRVLGLFVACALIPTVALTVVSYRHVTDQLLEETGIRLRGASKTAGMEIMLHLQGVRTSLEHLAAIERSGDPTPSPEPGIVSFGRSENGTFRVDAGTMRPPPPLPALQARHVAGGRVAILVDTSASTLRILLVRRLDPASARGPLIWAEVAPSYIWSSGGAGSLMTEDQDLCVFDSDLRPLSCTRPMPAEAVRAASTGRYGSFEWEGPGGSFLAGHFALFLSFEYGAPSWTVVVSEARSEVLAPLATFRRSFLAIVLLALGMVFLLSHTLIRRSLTPLEQLTRGTQRLAADDFSEPVVVEGQDEFRDLADSFNAMANQLQSQFGELRALHTFDRAALASTDRDGVVAAVLAAAEGTVGSRSAVLALADPDDPARWRVAEIGSDQVVWREVGLNGSARNRLARATAPITVAGGDADLAPLAATLGASHSALVLPIHHGQDVTAALVLGLPGAPAGPRQAASARQLADQVALALSRVQAMEELRSLNRGTLIALARTVDANSPWTAGHSERVSALSQVIGRSLGLAPEEIDRLEVGGLLHDVGKIGVSPDLLNKPGALTAGELEAVRAHASLGADILAPVRAYRDLLPLVRSHHELLDGSGYPDGLVGDQIPPLVRIMTVADIFDALVSDRPYRSALPLVDVVAVFRRGLHVKFDAGVVDTFLRALSAGHHGIWEIYPRLADQVAPATAPTDDALLTGGRK